MSSVVISGDTSGAITLAAPAVAGTNTITLPASTGTVLTTGSPQSGGVIQVVTTNKTDTFSTSSGSFVDVTGLSVSITPKFSTSTILVLAFVNGSISGTTMMCNLVRNSTNIAQPTGSPANGATTNITSAATDNSKPSTIVYLDSPATTSSTTYKLQVRTENGSTTGYVNRRADSATHAYISTITVMEIAA